MLKSTPFQVFSIEKHTKKSQFKDIFLILIPVAISATFTTTHFGFCYFCVCKGLNFVFERIDASLIYFQQSLSLFYVIFMILPWPFGCNFSLCWLYEVFCSSSFISFISFSFSQVFIFFRFASSSIKSGSSVKSSNPHYCFTASILAFFCTPIHFRNSSRIMTMLGTCLTFVRGYLGLRGCIFGIFYTMIVEVMTF